MNNEKSMLSDESNQDNIVEQNSIYDFFDGYTRPQVDQALKKLKSDEIDLLRSILEKNEEDFELSNSSDFLDIIDKVENLMIESNFVNEENNTSIPSPNVPFTGSQILDPLPSEEIDLLFDKFYQGDLNAKKTIAEHYIKLVLFIVHKHIGPTEYEKEDLISIGCVGLLRAIDSYDKTKQSSFTNYAYICILNEILRTLRVFGKKRIYVQSLNTPIYTGKDGEEKLLSDLISDDENRIDEFVENSDKNEIFKYLHKLVNSLPEKYKKSIKLCFGFYGIYLNKRELAEQVGCPINYINHYIFWSLRIMRRYIRKNENGKIIFDPDALPEFNYGRRCYSNIYEFLYEFDKEKIDCVLSMLSEEERKLIEQRFDRSEAGSLKDRFNREQLNKISSIIQKIKRRLNNLDNLIQKNDTIYDYFEGYSKEEIDAVLSSLSEKELHLISLKFAHNIDSIESGKMSREQTTKFNRLVNKIKYKLTKMTIDNKETQKEEITSDDYSTAKKALLDPIVYHLVSIYSMNEVMLALFKSGNINDKDYSDATLAKTFNVDPQDIENIVKKIENTYSEEYNKLKEMNIDTKLHFGPTLRRKRD